jgi:hypothetical protein
MVHTTEIKFAVLSERDIHATPIASNVRVLPILKLMAILVCAAMHGGSFLHIYE